MKAVVFEEFGGSDVLQLKELPDPEPGPGEVALDILASALNHLDVDVPASRSSRRSCSASRWSGASLRSARASPAGRSASE